MGRTSQEMVELIKSLEGYRYESYLCPAGVWTVGYGTTKIDGQPVKPNMKVPKVQAEEYLKKDLEVFEREVQTLPNVNKLEQRQFDALVCFCYNVGNGSFHRSTLRKMIIHDPNNPLISKELCKWNKANKKVLAGLTKRRAIEAAWYFLGSDYQNKVKDVIVWATS